MAASSLRRVALLVLLVGGAVASAHVAGCGLSTEGVPATGCKLDYDCVPAPPDPCKLFTCSAGGVCSSMPVADGPPPVQIPGDCQRVECLGGEAESSTDESDSDDGNPCTTDGCNADGTPSHVAVPEGTACASGVCMGSTCVVPCETSSDCPDQECKTASCDLAKHECAYQPLHGTPVSNDSRTDCLEKVCVMGSVTAVPNDAEAPAPMTCYSAVCTNGSPIYTPLADNTPCGNMLACDGAGKCVGCSDASDCPVDNVHCQVAECVAETCVVTNLQFGTGSPPQLQGEYCNAQTCNGAGQVVTVQDDDDEPPSDGNPCTDETCSGGNPSFPPLTGDACLTCPSLDGECVCTSAGECKDCINPATHCSPPGNCTTVACVANVCTNTLVPSGQDDNDDCKDDQDACGQDGECDGAGACYVEPPVTSCAPMGCQCNVVCQQQAISYCDGLGACSPGATQSCGVYTCNAGNTACLTSCTMSSQCVGGLQCAQSQCKQPLGAGCMVGSQCASGFCTDLVCCQTGSCSQCKSCNVVAGGTCQNDPFGTTCAANKQCDGGGSCKFVNGQPCNNDGDCLSDHCCGGPKECTASSC